MGSWPKSGREPNTIARILKKASKRWSIFHLGEFCACLVFLQEIQSGVNHAMGDASVQSHARDFRLGNEAQFQLLVLVPMLLSSVPDLVEANGPAGVALQGGVRVELADDAPLGFGLVAGFLQ